MPNTPNPSQEGERESPLDPLAKSLALTERHHEETIAVQKEIAKASRQIGRATLLYAVAAIATLIWLVVMSFADRAFFDGMTAQEFAEYFANHFANHFVSVASEAWRTTILNTPLNIPLDGVGNITQPPSVPTPTS